MANVYIKYLAVYYNKTLLSPSYVANGTLSPYYMDKWFAFKCPKGLIWMQSLTDLKHSHALTDLKDDEYRCTIFNVSDTWGDYYLIYS